MGRSSIESGPMVTSNSASVCAHSLRSSRIRGSFPPTASPPTWPPSSPPPSPPPPPAPPGTGRSPPKAPPPHLPTVAMSPHRPPTRRTPTRPPSLPSRSASAGARRRTIVARAAALPPPVLSASWAFHQEGGEQHWNKKNQCAANGPTTRRLPIGRPTRLRREPPLPRPLGRFTRDEALPNGGVDGTRGGEGWGGHRCTENRQRGGEDEGRGERFSGQPAGEGDNGAHAWTGTRAQFVTVGEPSTGRASGGGVFKKGSGGQLAARSRVRSPPCLSATVPAPHPHGQKVVAPYVSAQRAVWTQRCPPLPPMASYPHARVPMTSFFSAGTAFQVSERAPPPPPPQLSRCSTGGPLSTAPPP